jgi:DNA repair protein RadC
MQTYNNNIPMRNWAVDDLPDQKMLLKGVNSLSDAELLAIIIGTGIRNNSSLEIAKKILANSDNILNAFWREVYTDLKKFPGIGEKRAVKLLAIFALARRRNESRVIGQQKVTSSRDAFEIFHSLIGDLPFEELWMLILNKVNKVLKKVRISKGGVSGTVVDPKKIYKIALDHHSSSLILGHNHPSGNINPSKADISITKKFVEAGKLFDITVLDLLITAIGYFSFADKGHL